MAAFLDFSTGFDTVNHCVMLKKLELFGICDSPLKWSQDFLANKFNIWHILPLNRRMEKSYVECHRDPAWLYCWFNVHHFFSSVPSYCFSLSFADDTNITVKEIKIVFDGLNDDLEKTHEWLCCKKLSLNVFKNNFIIFAPTNKMVFESNRVGIERVCCTEFHGVIVDSFSMEKSYWSCM